MRRGADAKNRRAKEARAAPNPMYVCRKRKLESRTGTNEEGVQGWKVSWKSESTVASNRELLKSEEIMFPREAREKKAPVNLKRMKPTLRERGGAKKNRGERGRVE